MTNTSKKRDSFTHNVLKLAGGTTLAQLLTVLLAPVLARLYAPDAFGTAAVFVSISGIVSIIACLRYDLAILLPKDDAEAANLLGASLCIVAGVATLSALFFSFTHSFIIRLLNAPDLEPYLFLLPVAVLAQGAFLALSAWNSRIKRFGRLSIAQLGQAFATNGSQLLLGLTRQIRAGGLIGGSVLGYATVAAVLGAQIWRDDQALLRRVAVRDMRAAVQRYRRFPALEMWGAGLGGLAQHLPVFLFNVFFSATAVGYFSLSNRLVAIPVALLGNAIASVFFQRASELRASGTALTGVVENTFRQLVNLGLFPALFLAVVGQDLVVLVFGLAWSDAGLYLQFLSMWAFAQFIYSPISTTYVIIERQDLALAVHGSLFLSRLLALLLGGWSGNAQLTIALFSIVGGCVYGMLAVWMLCLAGSSARYAVATIGHNLVYCLPAIGVLALARWVFRSSNVIFFAFGLLTLVGYLVFIALTDLTIRDSLIAILHRAPESLRRRMGQPESE